MTIADPILATYVGTLLLLGVYGLHRIAFGPAVQGRIYTIEFSSTLVQDSWETLEVCTPDERQERMVFDNLQQREVGYYRIRVKKER